MGTTFRQKLTDNPVIPADGVILPCNDTDNVDGAFTLGTVKTFIGDDTLSRLGDEGTGTIATTTNLITDENKEVTVQDVADTTLSQLGDSGSASSVSVSTKFITDENKEVTCRQIADYVKSLSGITIGSLGDICPNFADFTNTREFCASFGNYVEIWAQVNIAQGNTLHSNGVIPSGGGCVMHIVNTARIGRAIIELYAEDNKHYHALTGNISQSEYKWYVDTCTAC